jgi:hypothetical protein
MHATRVAEASMTIEKLGSWVMVALAVASLFRREFWSFGLFAVVAIFALPYSYRVSHIFGIRVPWVRGYEPPKGEDEPY